jgi:V-type H+-transporting ATPase subunit a
MCFSGEILLGISNRVLSQAKRCEEMARKMRWFQNQLSKANQTPVCRHTLDKDLELEELEVEYEELH